MNYSAILVIALPGRLQDVITAINRIEGVEAHISDPDSDRLICTIEAPTTDDEVRLFHRVAELDGVNDVSLMNIDSILHKSLQLRQLMLLCFCALEPVKSLIGDPL